MNVTGDPLVEQICTQINHHAQQQQQAIQSLNKTTNALAFTASQLATVTERTEANTRQQQSETDQVATAMNEMNSTVDEVAHNASAAAEEQSQVANEINRNIVAIADIANQTSQDARDSRNTSVELADISQKIQQLVGQLGTSQATLDLSTAKAAHLNWKTKLRSFLDGKSTLSMEQAVSHRHCNFGKWYYSDGMEKFGHLHALRKVEKPHEELHELIRIIIDLKQHDRIQEAEQAYKNVERLSHDIVDHLNDAELEASRA